MRLSLKPSSFHKLAACFKNSRSLGEAREYACFLKRRDEGGKQMANCSPLATAMAVQEGEKRICDGNVNFAFQRN